MVNPEIPFEQHLARVLPEAMALQLHILPGHQELIAPLPTGYVGPVMAAAEAWLKQHGYRTLGPWMIAWGTNGQPQLRRPVSGALKAVRDKEFQTVEVPEQLLIAVPFVGWPILPHNFTYPVAAVGLEIVGSPLLLALTNDPPTTAWVPVVPRGTGGLFANSANKVGLQPTPPKAGQILSQSRAWLNALLLVGKIFTFLSVGVIFMASLYIGVLMLVGEFPLGTLDVALVSFVAFWLTAVFSVYILVPMAVLWVIIGLVKMGGVSSWNKFWSQRSPPPELLLGSRGEGQVGAWLG
jgi:hypothetical protein